MLRQDRRNDACTWRTPRGARITGLVLLLAVQMPAVAWATGDTGDTGLVETGDTGDTEPVDDTGETAPPVDTATDDTGDEGPDPAFGSPSAAQLAGETGGFRCDAVAGGQATGAVLLGLMAAFPFLLRRRA